MTLESFRIRLRRIPVTLELDGAGLLVGYLMCPKLLGAVTAEELMSFLDASERFLPFFPADNQDSSVLVNREQIVVVTLNDPPPPGGLELVPSVEQLGEDLSDEPETERRPEGTRRRVRFVLADQRELSGHVIVSAPLGHTRTQDVFNEAGRFLYCETAEGPSVLVNLSRVLVVADLPGD